MESFSTFSGPDALYASSRYGRFEAAWRAKAPKTREGLRRNGSAALRGLRGLASDSTPILNRGWTMSLSLRWCGNIWPKSSSRIDLRPQGLQR